MGVAGSTGGGPSAGSGGAPLGGAAGSAGHGGRAPSPLGGAAGGGAEGGGDGGAGGDSGSIWTPDSDSIDIQWFAYFRGGYHFTRQRDQLSPQQLELAQAIKVVPSSNACAADYIELAIGVTSGDRTQKYIANEYTADCQRGGTMVDYAAVSALLDTVNCVSSKNYDGSSASSAPNIVADDGCRHGLFNASGSTRDWWFRVEIPAAGLYRFGIDACNDRQLRLDLFESDGTTELESASGSGSCPLLMHQFAHAGTNLVRVAMLSGVSAGDFYFGVTRP